jgi:hypothetical protein
MMCVKTIWYSTLTGLVLWLISLGAIANELKTDDGYIIHYSVFSSEILPAEVAHSYKIVRSKNQAVLNVVVRKNKDDKSAQTEAVAAKVTAQAVNLAQQLKTLELRKIEEGEADSKAIYYIATFKVTNEETFNFTVKVDPENKGKEHEIKFSQQFFD